MEFQIPNLEVVEIQTTSELESKLVSSPKIVEIGIGIHPYGRPSFHLSALTIHTRTIFNSHANIDCSVVSIIHADRF